MRPVMPTSLIVVACIFIAVGLTGLATSLMGLYRGTGGAAFSILDLLNLVVGLGLLRRDPYWHRAALVVCWLRIVVTGIPLTYLVLGSPWMRSTTLFGQPLYQIPRAYVLAFVLANLTITVWALRVLRHPTVRGLFASQASAGQSAAQAP
jgi:hypothetical protein